MRFITSGRCLKLYFLVCLLANKQTRALAPAEWVARGKNLTEKKEENGERREYSARSKATDEKRNTWCTSWSIASCRCNNISYFICLLEKISVSNMVQSGFFLMSSSSSFCHGKCLWRDSGAVMQFFASQHACHCWYCVSKKHMDSRLCDRLTQTALRLLMRPCVVYRHPDSTKPSSWFVSVDKSRCFLTSSCSVHALLCTDAGVEGNALQVMQIM